MLMMVMTIWMRVSCVEWDNIWVTTGMSDESWSQPEISVDKASGAVKHNGDSLERWNRHIICQKSKMVWKYNQECY